MPNPETAHVYFPDLNGGEKTGFNDAGVEQFKHDRIESLVRECTQNSTDAIDLHGGQTKVRIVFELIRVPTADLPGAAELRDHLQACLDYVNTPEARTKEKKALAFFQKAVQLLDRETIPCMLVRVCCPVQNETSEASVLLTVSASGGPSGAAVSHSS